jgi:hypothetical protein
MAGFLLGLLIFGAPWHLPPDWGDIPTWILAVFAVIAGVVAFVQLGLLKQQLDEDRQLNAKRDELFDRQIAADRRTQAEDIVVRWLRVHSGQETGIVENKSRRPVTGVSCKVMSNVDRHVLELPDECGERFEMSGQRGGKMFFAPDLKPLQVFKTLRPHATCAFIFKGTDAEPDQVLVAWFTDDAGYRWQLDEYLHLVQVDDDEEHEYRQ